jgi:hypothetical protein
MILKYQAGHPETTAYDLMEQQNWAYSEELKQSF